MTGSCCLCLRLLPLDIHFNFTAVCVWLRYQCSFKLCSLFSSLLVVVCVRVAKGWNIFGKFPKTSLRTHGYTFGLVKVKLIKIIFVLEHLTLLHLWIKLVSDIYMKICCGSYMSFSIFDVNIVHLNHVWLWHTQEQMAYQPYVQTRILIEISSESMPLEVG